MERVVVALLAHLRARQLIQRLLGVAPALAELAEELLGELGVVAQLVQRDLGQVPARRLAARARGFGEALELGARVGVGPGAIKRLGAGEALALAQVLGRGGQAGAARGDLVGQRDQQVDGQGLGAVLLPLGLGQVVEHPAHSGPHVAPGAVAPAEAPARIVEVLEQLGGALGLTQQDHQLGGVDAGAVSGVEAVSALGVLEQLSDGLRGLARAQGGLTQQLDALVVGVVELPELAGQLPGARGVALEHPARLLVADRVGRVGPQLGVRRAGRGRAHQERSEQPDEQRAPPAGALAPAASLVVSVSFTRARAVGCQGESELPKAHAVSSWCASCHVDPPPVSQ